MSGRGRGRGSEISSRLSGEYGARHGALSHSPEIHKPKARVRCLTNCAIQVPHQKIFTEKSPNFLAQHFKFFTLWPQHVSGHPFCYALLPTLYSHLDSGEILCSHTPLCSLLSLGIGHSSEVSHKSIQQNQKRAELLSGDPTKCYDRQRPHQTN